MDAIKKFLADHNVTTHSIAAVIATFGVLYASVQPFHDLVVKLFAATPSWVHELVTVGVGIYAFYHKPEATPPAIP